MDDRSREQRRSGHGGGGSQRRPHRDSREGHPQESSRGGGRSIASYFSLGSSRQGGPSSGPSRGASQSSSQGSSRRPAQGSASRRSDRDRDPRHGHIEVSRAAYPPGQRGTLKADARETLRILPQILRQLGTRDQAADVAAFDPFSLPAIGPSRRPRYTQPATIRVVNNDTLNAAVELLGWPTQTPPHTGAPRPLIVNFASHARPGGGWLSGALAQEEAICYRSSLYLSISESRYPMGREEVLYSPYVLLMRSDRSSGHNLLTFSVAPHLLPVVSAVSVAAIRSPPLRAVAEDIPRPIRPLQEDAMTDAAPPPRPARRERIVYAYETDRFETKLKMRLTLRTAASNGHDQLVLGALGCGVFANPPEEVARCWLEVLQEPEFRVVSRTAGGREEARHWWKDVVFAIYDGQPGQGGRTDIGAQGGGSQSNLAIFREVLEGQMV